MVRLSAGSDKNSRVGGETEENPDRFAVRHPRGDFSAALRLQSRSATPNLLAHRPQRRVIPPIETGSAPLWGYAHKGGGDLEHAGERGRLIGDSLIAGSVGIHDDDRVR